jgi:hypothetical protein
VLDVFDVNTIYLSKAILLDNVDVGVEVIGFGKDGEALFCIVNIVDVEDELKICNGVAGEAVPIPTLPLV